MATNLDGTATQRCPWCGTAPDYVAYHDQIWGVPEYDNHALFAKLCLDGQQAGLSWITILRKQANYEAAFLNFNPERLSGIQGDERRVFMEEQMQNAGIVRNRLKIESIFRNADSYMALQRQGIKFSDFLWDFVGGVPIQNAWRAMSDVPVATPESEAMSKALKKAGFNFVGPTIVYAFMQATGMVNDHLVSCPRYEEVRALSQ
ncbi:MAG: DNA-3-methyladenine glycosylase I [Idiomarina sp.]|nr:DNA-3-methyladenine glycosylase I [Idiomarina sp.]